jgi:2-C-methyl-D-erythritol 4-phosphate cytidylyltransferase
MQVAAIIPAAGQGARFGGEIPKQFLVLSGRSLLEVTIERIAQAELIQEIVVVVAPDRVVAMEAGLKAIHPKVQTVVAGGATRQASVTAGVRATSPEVSLVAVHDAARPCVDPQLVDRCIEAAAGRGAAILAAPAADTIKLVTQGNLVSETIPRGSIWLAQTPQVVNRELMLEAIDHAETHGLTGTDEAALVEALGKPVAIVESSRWNIKVTLPEDLVIAEALLSREVQR